MASISIQGIFTPFIHNGRVLVDGGIVNPVPVDVVKKMGADFIIASVINSSKKVEEEKKFKSKEKIKIPSIFTIILQSIDIMQKKIINDSLSKADLVISSETSSIKLLEFYRAKEAIEAGRKAAKKILKKIK